MDGVVSDIALDGPNINQLINTLKQLPEANSGSVMTINAFLVIPSNSIFKGEMEQDDFSLT